MKTYTLILSKDFPKKHPKAGKPTAFVEKIKRREKIHTIRTNYEFWKKRIDEVRDGKAVLSLRQWSEKPYRSKQVIVGEITAEDKPSIQKIEKEKQLFYIRKALVCPYQLAQNDGLTMTDFKHWFKHYDTQEPLALIHFTEFNY